MNNSSANHRLTPARVLLLAALLGGGAIVLRAKLVERQEAAYMASAITDLQVLVGAMEKSVNDGVANPWGVYPEVRAINGTEDQKNLPGFRPSTGVSVRTYPDSLNGWAGKAQHGKAGASARCINIGEVNKSRMGSLMKGYKSTAPNGTPYACAGN